MSLWDALSVEKMVPNGMMRQSWMQDALRPGSPQELFGLVCTDPRIVIDAPNPLQRVISYDTKHDHSLEATLQWISRELLAQSNRALGIQANTEQGVITLTVNRAMLQVDGPSIADVLRMLYEALTRTCPARVDYDPGYLNRLKAKGLHSGSTFFKAPA